MQGIRRKLGVAPTQKTPVLVGDLRGMVRALPKSLLGTRDRALLVLGFAGGFRRSELVGLDVADLIFGGEGLTVRLRRSKTDQEGAGRKVGVPYGSDGATCPVRSLKSWLDASGIGAGAVFVGLTRHGTLTGKRLDGRDVARAVKRAAAAVGLDASTFSGR
jgi:site-specific recombinase XerC